MNIRSCIFQFFLLGLLCTWWPLEGATAQKVLITGAPPQQLDIDASSLSAASQASDWQAFTGKTPANGGDIWFRQEISLVWNDALQAQNPLALSLQVKGLYDAYWDGALIGSNKYRGGSAPEFSRLMLPVSNLSDGNHWLYIHIQAKGLPVGENIDLGIYPTDLSSDFFGIHFTVVIVFLVAVSSYLASGYFLYVGWRGPNALTYRLAALITFATGSIIYLDRAKFLTPYPYLWQPGVETALAALTITFLLAIALYSALRLKLQRPFVWAGGGLIALALAVAPIGPYDTDTRALLFLGLYILLMTAAAWKTVPATAKLMGAASILGMVALLIQPDEKMLFIGSVALLFGTELAVDIYRRNRETQRLSLLSARLRGDLLKQNIRPHFLMNALTALMEWIETSPDDAVNFVDMLATEFRILIDFSDRSEVQMRSEVELCETHIKLMSQRLGSSITLHSENADLDSKIPPAIFHTLIENAFNHNDYRGEEVSFTLSSQTTKTGSRHQLSVPIIAPTDSPLGTGLGTRYVLARLEEFCGKAFRFRSEQVGSNWISEIEILRG